MSKSEFEKAVWEENKKYCLLDDLVIDVASFMDKHPGGRFVINHNIGRDISKYFHGGYSLEGNDQSRP